MSKSSRKKSRCKYGVKNSSRCRRSPGGKKSSRSKSSRCKYGIKKSSRCRRSPGGRSRSRDSKGRFKKKSASKKKSRKKSPKKKMSPKKSPKKKMSPKKSPKKKKSRKKSPSKKKMSRKKSPSKKKMSRKKKKSPIVSIPKKKTSPKKRTSNLNFLLVSEAKKVAEGRRNSLSPENMQKLRILVKAAQSCDNKKMKKVFNSLRPESLQQRVLSAMAKDGLNYEDGTFVLA